MACTSPTGRRLGTGALIVLALALPILLGLYVFKMSFDELARDSSPAPAATRRFLAYANRITPTDRPDIGHALIFPASRS
jgi:putative transport protein